jgi:hypothetical protein
LFSCRSSVRIDKFFVLSANDRHPAAVIWGCKVRRSTRLALGVGVALITIAAVGSARADVVAIDLDPCSTSCMATGIEDPDDPAGDDAVAMSRSSGAGDPSGLRHDLIFDSRALPPVLASGLPSPIMSVGARALDDPGVSPYAFFEDVIDVSHSADSRAFTAVPSRLSAFLWASSDFFGRPSGAIASRRGLPLSADADALTGRLTTGWTMRRPTPTLSPSPLSGPPSSDAAEPFGQVGDEAGRSAEFSSDGAKSNK